MKRLIINSQIEITAGIIKACANVAAQYEHEHGRQNRVSIHVWEENKEILVTATHTKLTDSHDIWTIKGK